MPGRRRGARTGRGWDAAPPRPRPAHSQARQFLPEEVDPEAPLWLGEEAGYRRREAGGPSAGGPSAGKPRAGTSGSEDDQPGDDQPRDDPAERARRICLELLSVRPRTRLELANALRRRRIPDEVASSVLDRYDEVGMIDDAAFARAWVSSRHHGRGLARRALASELRQRGIDSEIVGAALAEVDEQTEAATARELVDRRLRTMGSAGPEVVLRRLVGVLARKGYPPGLAVRVVKQALADAEDERTAGYAELLDPDGADDLVGDADEPIR